jgi:hypothetical protein
LWLPITSTELFPRTVDAPAGQGCSTRSRDSLSSLGANLLFGLQVFRFLSSAEQSDPFGMCHFRASAPAVFWTFNTA